MTKLLDEAVATLRRLPSEDQDDFARLIMQLAKADGEPEAIDPAHLPAVLRGLAEAKRREFANEKEVEAAFRRFGP
jgi:hypothetical protein